VLLRCLQWTPPPFSATNPSVPLKNPPPRSLSQRLSPSIFSCRPESPDAKALDPPVAVNRGPWSEVFLYPISFSHQNNLRLRFLRLLHVALPVARRHQTFLLAFYGLFLGVASLLAHATLLKARLPLAPPAIIFLSCWMHATLFVFLIICPSL